MDLALPGDARLLASVGNGDGRNDVLPARVEAVTGLDQHPQRAVQLPEHRELEPQHGDPLAAVGNVRLRRRGPTPSGQVACNDAIEVGKSDARMSTWHEVFRLIRVLRGVHRGLGQHRFDVAVFVMQSVRVGGQEGTVLDDVPLVVWHFARPVEGRRCAGQFLGQRRDRVGPRTEPIASLHAVLVHAGKPPRPPRRARFHIEARVRLHSPVGGIEPCGERPPAGHGQAAVDHRQVALRRQAEVVGASVVAHAVFHVRHRIGLPQDLARGGVDRRDVDALFGPDSSTEVDDAVLDHRPAPYRPT